MSDVARDYDWERYEDEWKPSDAYAQQEEQLAAIFQTLGPIEAVLEVGPGLGRITRLALKQWPMAEYSAADVALAPLAEAQRLSGGLAHELHGPVQQMGQLPWKFNLVLAIEVLMHVPPDEVGAAIENLFDALRPGGHLITCDWTRDYGDVPIRVSNYRHDYMQLFRQADAGFIGQEPTGAQTIFVVQP